MMTLILIAMLACEEKTTDTAECPCTCEGCQCECTIQ